MAPLNCLRLRRSKTRCPSVDLLSKNPGDAYERILKPKQRRKQVQITKELINKLKFALVKILALRRFSP